MSNPKKQTLGCLKRALLGVCFWMGHRRSLYRDYPLGEAEIVAELCNLLFANLPPDMKILCKVQYSMVVPNADTRTTLLERSRIDICVCGPMHKGEEPLDNVEFALEAKRGGAPPAVIEEDLRRLAQLKKARPGIRAFLLLISERRRPKRFVTDEGKRVTRVIKITGTDAYCRVRVVMKAVPAVTKLDNAYYGCAIEVLPPKSPNRAISRDYTKVHGPLHLRYEIAD